MGPTCQSKCSNSRKTVDFLTNRKSVISHNDNATRHVAKQTLQKVEELKRETFQHPPCSSDLIPSDLDLFQLLQNYLNWQNIWLCTISRKLPHNLLPTKGKTQTFCENSINKPLNNEKRLLETMETMYLTDNFCVWVCIILFLFF